MVYKELRNPHVRKTTSTGSLFLCSCLKKQRPLKLLRWHFQVRRQWLSSCLSLLIQETTERRSSVVSHPTTISSQVLWPSKKIISFISRYPLLIQLFSKSVLRDDYSASFHRPKPFTAFTQGLVSPYRTVPIRAQTLLEEALCQKKPTRKVAPWGLRDSHDGHCAHMLLSQEPYEQNHCD